MYKIERFSDLLYLLLYSFIFIVICFGLLVLLKENYKYGFYYGNSCKYSFLYDNGVHDYLILKDVGY